MPENDLSPLSILHTESSRGAGGQILRILRESALLSRRGHQVRIVCHPEASLAQLAPRNGLEVVPFAFPRRLYSPVPVFALARLFRQIQPHVVITHSSADSWTAGLAARLAKVPVTLRTRHIHSPVRAYLFNRFLYGRLADAVITTGARVGDILSGELRLDRSHFVSIPTGVDLTRFTGQGAREKVRQEWNLRDDHFAIGVVAALRGMKNHRLLIKAAARLREQYPQARFFIVGDGTPRGDLEAYAAELGLQDALTFTGHRDDVPDVMAALDIVALTSSRGEGVPQSLSQALAMQKPVVATDVGSVSEIVRNEKTGLLVPSENLDAFVAAAKRLIENPSLAASLAAAGRRLIETSYSETKIAQDTEDLVIRLLRAKRGRR